MPSHPCAELADYELLEVTWLGSIATPSAKAGGDEASEALSPDRAGQAVNICLKRVRHHGPMCPHHGAPLNLDQRARLEKVSH